MEWDTTVGSIAVLAVVGLCAGVATSLATANGLLLDSARAVPAIGALLVVVAGFLLTIVLAGPSREWTSNPYW